jgi:hypothetical protein
MDTSAKLGHKSGPDARFADTTWECSVRREPLRGLAIFVGGVLLGVLLSLGITLLHTQTRVLDGVRQRVVVFAVNSPQDKEGLFELPADLLPYRVVGTLDATNQEAVCPALDHFYRMGLLFSIGGVVFAWAVARGAPVVKSLGAGVLAGALVLGALSGFVPLSVPAQHGVEFSAVLFGLMAACGEALYALQTNKRRHARD